MATTKKTEVKEICKKDTNVKEKATATATVTVAETPVAQVEIKPTAKKEPLKSPELDEMILCRSVVHGELIYISQRTAEHIEWAGFGSEEYIQYSELKTMKNTQGKFLNEPWIVIEDERAIHGLGLDNLYSKMINIDDLEAFFVEPISVIEQKIQQSPKGIRVLIASKAREMVENNTLYDNRIISLIEKELGIDLKVIEE